MQCQQNAASVRAIVATIKDRFHLQTPVSVGVILGTGFSHLCVEKRHEIAYADLPGFPISTTASHAGAFVLGEPFGLPVLFAAGRCHLYEGWSAGEVCLGVRVLHGLGVRTLIVTNASGALNPGFPVGEILCITDQINATGVSPLRGPNCEEWGPRFPDMSVTFDRALIARTAHLALHAGIPLYQGVYIGVHGPELETPAETRLYRMLGADAIGMSSVLEVIAARHLGMRVLGLSCLSNKNLPDCMQATSIEDILAACAQGEAKLSRILSLLLEDFADFAKSMPAR